MCMLKLCMLSVYSCSTWLIRFFLQITSEIWDIFKHILFQCLDIDKQTQQPLPSTWNAFKIEIYHTWTHCLVSQTALHMKSSVQCFPLANLIRSLWSVKYSQRNTMLPGTAKKCFNSQSDSFGNIRHSWSDISHC